MSQGVPCNVHVIVTGIAHCLKSSKFFTLSLHVDMYCMKNNMYTLHVISLEFTENPCQFTGISLQTILFTWFPHSCYMISQHLM